MVQIYGRTEIYAIIQNIMQSIVTSQSTLLPLVIRLEKELTRLKAMLGWGHAVRRGISQAKKQKLSPDDVLGAIYESRYPASRRS